MSVVASPSTMLLGPVSLSDCLVFLIFLAPQLVLQAGLFPTVISTLYALPFLLFRLPLQMIRQRCWADSSTQSSFTKGSTVFEDFIVRCVRYSFVALPVPISRVFFSKWVVLPFLRWRMLKHGYPTCPVHWQEYTQGGGLRRLEGIWVTHDPDRQPDVVVYYVHGGGFALGSTYFYLELQMALNSLLVGAGYNNPAIFSVEYTLVPDGQYPMQLNEIIRGYEHILRVAGDASRVCVAGDSAGGTLVLSLLQVLGNTQTRGPSRKDVELLDASTAIAHGTALPIPGMATLISPWVTLMSSTLFSPSGADYLDPRTLRLYARKYAGESGARRYPASPGSCDEEQVWRSSSPGRGYFVIYGEDEVFASDIENFVRIQERLGVEIRTEKIEARVHAWPVVSLFASSTEDARLGGLRSIVDEIRNRI